MPITTFLGALLATRIIRAPSHTSTSTTMTIAELFHLESEDPDKDISLYINHATESR